MYPVSAILRHTPGSQLKHTLSVVVGVALMQWIYGPDWIHSFVTSAGTYLLCLFVPRRYCPTVVFVFVMGYMVGAHLYRMYVSYLSGIFDFTGTQMVLTMKLTSFAYNLYDGTADRARVYGQHEKKADAKVYADRKRFAIDSLPDPLAYFGYVYCFTCLLAGPAFEYQDYIRAVDGTAFIPHSPESTKLSGDKSQVIPQSSPTPLWAAMSKLLSALFFMGAHLVGSAYAPQSLVYDPAFISSHSFLYRCAYLYITMVQQRCKYYFVWLAAEGASNLGGFGFQGFDASGRALGWQGVNNMDVIGFETAASIQQLSRSWNKRTQGWLERYTYQRAGRSLLLTYFVSAVWHGLYPGFFVFFMSVPLLTSVERLTRAKLTPIFAPGFDGFNLDTYPKTSIARAYWVVCLVVSQAIIAYTAQVFHYGSLERSLTALGSYYYLGHILSMMAYVALILLPTPKGDKKKE